jgi:PhnB protein
MYVPEGFGTVFPYMIVDGADEYVAFLSQVFGATELGRTELPNGRIANIRIEIGTSKFMISQADSEALKPMPGAYYVFVEDVDKTFENATANGAEKIFEPADMPYLDRQAGVSDPFGNIWWISRRLVDEPYDV